MKQPNFMCIGAPKSGTTSLYSILKQHPDIYVTGFKEPHFFDNDENYQEGYTWYLNEYYSSVKEEVAVGEFTPSYLASAKARERLFGAVGNQLKLIVILRNPVDRAYSQYLHIVRDGHETLSFEEALLAEKERMSQCVKDNDDVGFNYYSYIHQGLYSQHLKEYISLFGKKNVHVIIFDDEFMKNKDDTIKGIFDFLGVKKCKLNTGVHANVASVSRSIFIKKLLQKDSVVRRFFKKMISSKTLRQKINNRLKYFNNKKTSVRVLSPEIKKRICLEYFINDIKKLEKLTNRKLGIWHE